MSTIKTDTLQNVAGTKSVPVNTVVDGSAKAWVNFNGIGTVAIRAAFNVGSVTDNGVGSYTVNLTTAISTDYSAVGACRGQSDTDANSTIVGVGASSSGAALAVFTKNGANTLVDTSTVNVAIFR